MNLDDDVFEALQKRAIPLEDDINDVLRRELGLTATSPSTEEANPPARRSMNRRPGPTNRYRYSESDDLVAFYIYKCGDGNLPQSTDTIGNTRGMGSNSLRMRISNFRAIDTDGREGLRNWAKQSEAVYGEYNDKPCEELRELVLRIL